MKKIYPLLLLIVSSTFFSNAQTVTSFSVTPVNPTTDDTVKVIIESMFPYGSCDGTASLTGISGNTIIVDAFHCMGMLTVICTDYDTILIPPLASGQYSFVFILSAGQGIPCTPGIVPSDTGTVNFTVTDATGIPKIPGNKLFQIQSNPSSGKFVVKHSFEGSTLLYMYSIDGKLIFSDSISKNESEINGTFPAGVYIIALENKDKRYFTKVIVAE